MAGVNNYSTLMYATAETQHQKQQQQQLLPSNEDTDEGDEKQLHQHIFTTATSGAAQILPNNINFQRQHLHYPLADSRHQQQFYMGTTHNTASSLKYVNSERDLSLPLEKHKTLHDYYESQDEDLYHTDAVPQRTSYDNSSFSSPNAKQISVRKYLGIGVQWVSLVTENLLSHPFIVLRRQCQVFTTSKRDHLHPFALIPAIVHLHRRQGVTTLWKGLGSCLLVRGMSLAVEDMFSKATSWPKDVDSRTTCKRFGQHLVLKCISIAVVVPFYAASLVETVQSDIASEKPGLLDVFREGSLRLLYWSSPQKGRMLPVWALIGPTVSVGMAKYLFGLVIKGISSRIMHRRLQRLQERKGAKYKDDTFESQNVEIYSNLISVLTTEVIFYPFETILHRIQLQGTRTIIDNLDNGYAVVPILTNYQGAIDCYRTTIATEGYVGFYKGFGAIILQFAAHIAVIKFTKWVVNQITEVISSRPSANVMRYYNLDHGLASNSTTISPTLSTSSEMGDVQSVDNRSVD